VKIVIENIIASHSLIEVKNFKKLSGYTIIIGSGLEIIV